MIKNLTRKAKRFWALEPQVRFKFLSILVTSKVYRIYEKIKTKLRGDFNPSDHEIGFKSHGFYLECLPTKGDDFIDRCVDRWLHHEYNVLGSGWIVHCVSERQYAFKNRKTESYSQAILKYVDSDYKYVQWHQDIKSNFVYDHNTVYHKIKIPINQNTDIKNLWEISRMQHLILVAHRYNSSRDEKVLSFILSNFLDFIAHNPPGRGVNWACTMDVSIRLVNLLITLDILIQSDARIEKKVYEVILKSLQDHANFISSNLEWSPTVRGNHYYSNLAGLIIFKCYTTSDLEIPERKFTKLIDEFISETFSQFNEDGSNFEGSTYYHFLAMEMLIYTLFPLERLGILKTLDQSKIDELNKRLELSIGFMEAIELPNGNILQIGDTDSGAFVKFNMYECNSTLGVNAHKQNNIGDGNTYPINDAENYINKKQVIEHTKTIAVKILKYSANYELRQECQAYFNKINNYNLHGMQLQTYIYRSQGDLLKNLQTFIFPSFGLVVKKGDNIFLSFRCGAVGQNGNGGHSHFDQLSIELWIDNKPLLVDPGSVCYTPNLGLRDAYRSSKAHFVPIIKGISEPGEMGESAFSIKKIAAGHFLEIGPHEITAVHQGYGFDVFRKICIRSTELQVKDYHFSDKHELELRNNISVMPCIGYSVVSGS